jgi:Zn finger protein HypA/HybF involved in hydrogenase expression
MKNMPSAYEVVQLINSQFGQQIENTIADVNDLIERIEYNSRQFTYELTEEVEHLALKSNKCPLCGCNLVKLDSEYESSEYNGQVVQEELSKYGCESLNCGYIKE